LFYDLGTLLSNSVQWRSEEVVFLLILHEPSYSKFFKNYRLDVRTEAGSSYSQGLARILAKPEPGGFLLKNALPCPFSFEAEMFPALQMVKKKLNTSACSATAYRRAASYN
jgi:hypothetical protein